jgi:hypothetical protein
MGSLAVLVFGVMLASTCYESVIIVTQASSTRVSRHYRFPGELLCFDVPFRFIAFRSETKKKNPLARTIPVLSSITSAGLLSIVCGLFVALRVTGCFRPGARFANPARASGPVHFLARRKRFLVFTSFRIREFPAS